MYKNLIKLLIELQLLLNLFMLDNNNIKLKINAIQKELINLNYLTNSLTKENLENINNIENLNKIDLLKFSNDLLNKFFYSKELT